MANCTSGLSLAREGQSNCDNVQGTCAYALCSDPFNSAQCYGLDARLGLQTNYPSYSYNCYTNCPVAWDPEYPLAQGNTAL